VSGHGEADGARRALEEAEGEEYEVFEGDGVVAVASRDVELDDVLVGAEFSEIDVPDGSGDPSELLEEVEERIDRLEDELDGIQSRMDELRDENASFLLPRRGALDRGAEDRRTAPFRNDDQLVLLRGLDSDGEPHRDGRASAGIRR